MSTFAHPLSLLKLVRIPQFPKFKCFAESTKLHGIARVAEGSKLSKAFWAVLVVISVGMAINDLVIMVNNYRSEPTAIQLSLVRSDNFSWPTPTLCMEMLVDYKDNNPGGLRDNLFLDPAYIDPPIPALYLDWSSKTWESKIIFNALLDRLHQFYERVASGNYPSNISSLYPDGYDNPNLLYYPYMMLGYLTDLEQNLTGQNISYVKENQFNLVLNDLQLAQHVQMFYDALINRNVSMAAFKQAMGMWFCLKQLTGKQLAPFANPQIPSTYGQFESFRYFGDPNYTNLPLCKANMITHLGFGMVCSKIFETPNVPLVPDYTLFEIYDTHFTMAQDTFSKTLNAAVAALVPGFRWHLDLQGRNVIPSGDQTNIFSWSPLENVVLEIAVDREYQFVNSRQRSCSNAPVNQYDCKRQKRVKFVYEKCGCWPSLVDTQSHKSDVNCSVNTTTPLTVYNLSVEHFCSHAKLFRLDPSDCEVNCHIWKFSSTRKPARKTANSFEYTFEYNRWGPNTSPVVSSSIQFSFATGSHMLISESFTTDWSTFLSVWGGSIGTWLGNKFST